MSLDQQRISEAEPKQVWDPSKIYPLELDPADQEASRSENRVERVIFAGKLAVSAVGGTVAGLYEHSLEIGGIAALCIGGLLFSKRSSNDGDGGWFDGGDGGGE